MASVSDLLDSDQSKAKEARHPEKAHRPDQPVMRKPDWIRVKAPGSPQWALTQKIVKDRKLVTVCEEAGCPNIGECWEKRHATFMIMGDTCTRACAFCNVKTGLPRGLDPDEPARVADAVEKLSARPCRRHLGRSRRSRGRRGRAFCKSYRGDPGDESRHHDRGADAGFLAQARRARDRRHGQARCVQPQSRNGRVEISRAFGPGARYFHSIRLLQRVKELDPTMFTKSGIMVGLGEERHEVLQLMDDLRSADVDFLTIGQYLQPTKKHHAIARFVTPDEFSSYGDIARAKGFLLVSASPLTRSSHHAGEDFAKLKARRLALRHSL